jgi:hypothetical protein
MIVFSGLPSGWQLYYWDPATNSYLDKYRAKIQPGRGFWLKVPYAVSYAVDGNPNLDFLTEVSLGAGYNMIGVPYNEAFPWDSVQVVKGSDLVSLDQAVSNGWIASVGYYWEDGAYKQIKSGYSFQPLTGYWLKAKAEGCSLIFTP